MQKSVAAAIARNDIRKGLKNLSLAWFLAWEDIRQRYVRTLIGPLWIVLSTGVWFTVMGFVMASLFGQDLASYMPFIICGLLIWTLIFTSINESSQLLVASQALINSFPIPIFTHYIRFILRNYIIFLHNLIILAIVLCIYPPQFTLYTWLALPGLLLVFVILLGASVCLSLTNLRYRDTHLAVASAMQVLPFITPIFWDRPMLKNNHWIADLNPFYHMIEIVRAPLLGNAPSLYSWCFALALAAGTMGTGYLMFLRYRHRIIFWL